MAVIGIAVIATVSALFADIYATARTEQNKVDLLNTIAQIQLTIVNTVNDSNSWNTTISDTHRNSSMGCISAQNCGVVNPTPFVLWPAGGATGGSTSSYPSSTGGYTISSNTSNAVYDGTNASAGFTLTGKACSTFSSTGSPDCPLHVDLKWSVPTACSPAPCTPVVWITANVTYRPGPHATITNINENLLKLTAIQQLSSTTIPCSGSVPSSELAICQSPPYQGDAIVCTATGFRCGQVFY